MDYDYFSIDAILAENQVGFIDQIDRRYIILQKIQCTFKIDVPRMGHLGGGSDKDVCSHRPSRYHHA